MVAQLDRDAVRAAPGRAISRLITYSLFEGRPATTRGRWINPVVRANLHGGAALHLGRRRVEAPIFIVGIGRSGTTLLGQLLGLHPDVGYLNEPKALWHEIHHEDDIIGSYAPSGGRLLLTASDVDDETRSRAHRMYSWYLACSRSRRVVDKYPELAYRESFVRSIFPDAQFVVIRRHPWDVVRSITVWNLEHADDSSNWWGVSDRKWWTLWNEVVLGCNEHQWIADEVDPATAPDSVRACVEWYVGTTVSAALSGHHLDYDDLLTEPRETLNALMLACSLRDSDRVLEHADRAVRPRRDHRTAPDEIPLVLVERCQELYARIGGSCES